MTRRKKDENVLLITVDCLRADRLSISGYPRNVTPNIDRLASEGLFFTQAYSVSPWTTPSFVSILSSTYPLMFDGDLSMQANRTSVVEILKHARYHTFGLTYHPYLLKATGFGNGFDIYRDITETFQRKYPRHTIRDEFENFVSHILGIDLRWRRIYDAAQLTREAIELIDDLEKPFFLWIHYLDPHWDYTFWRIPNGFNMIRYILLSSRRRRALKTRSLLGDKDIKDLIKINDSKIVFVDRMIGQLLHSLSNHNLIDDTHIIVTADHGDGFQEHGYIHHEYYLYQELLHVPLIIKTPFEKPSVIDHPVSLIDLSPTILDLVGIKKPSSFLGKSLMLLLQNKKDVSAVFSEEGQTIHLKPEIDWKKGTIRLNLNAKQICYINSGWKYIYSDTNQHELYNLTQDPFEKKNLINDERVVASNMRDAVIDHIQFNNSFKQTERQRVRERIKNLRTEIKALRIERPSKRL